MSFVPGSQAVSGAGRIFRIVIVCFFAFGLATVLWRIAGSLRMPRTDQLLIDAAIGVVLMLTLHVARTSWRSAVIPPSAGNSPNGPVG